VRAQLVLTLNHSANTSSFLMPEAVLITIFVADSSEASRL